MSKILDFVPRPEYDELRWQRMSANVQDSISNPSNEPLSLTSGELYGILYGETAESMRRLIAFYKCSGKWNAEAESQMTKIVKSMQTLCETIAHATIRPGQTK